MTAPVSRPPVPRPTARSVVERAPLAPCSSSRESSPKAIPRAYVAEPPVIRERQPSTLELADDDLLEEQVMPVAQPRRSTPPPPPPIRSTLVPKAKGIAIPKIAPLVMPKIDTTVMAAPPMPVAQPEPAPESHVQIREQAQPKRESMLDPSEALFDGMYEMNYADSQWSAARLCATVLAKALGARTVIVHAHDLASRELRAIGVSGEGEFDVLGSSDASEDDLVASAVICNERPVTMRFDGELPRLAPRRLGMIGRAPRTLVAVPAMAWGRCVAVIEIIDADERLAARVADSGSYVAERLAAFLSNRAAA